MLLVYIENKCPEFANKIKYVQVHRSKIKTFRQDSIQKLTDQLTVIESNLWD